MAEKWRQCLDKGRVSGVLLTYLSKAANCILHDFLIAKLVAYGFDYNSLQMLQSHLSNKNKEQQLMMRRISIVKFCLELDKVLYQGCCYLIFIFYMFDMFYDINDCDIVSYADDNTPYASSSNLDAVINKLGESTYNLFQWFRNSHMKTNADKCHFLFRVNYVVSANIDEFEIESKITRY